jgi:hypothetical protein
MLTLYIASVLNFYYFWYSSLEPFIGIQSSYLQ